MEQPSPQPDNRLLLCLMRVEEIVLTSLLLAMILLGCGQVLLRSVFSSGLLWVDPLLRYLVLWSGLLGASMATGRGKHIALDVLTYIASERVKLWLQVLTQLFSTLVAGVLVWASLLFIRSEYDYGGPGPLAMPSWVWNLIFPLAFSLICLRFLLATCTALRDLRSSFLLQPPKQP